MTIPVKLPSIIVAVFSAALLCACASQSAAPTLRESAPASAMPAPATQHLGRGLTRYGGHDLAFQTSARHGPGYTATPQLPYELMNAGGNIVNNTLTVEGPAGTPVSVATAKSAGLAELPAGSKISSVHGDSDNLCLTSKVTSKTLSRRFRQRMELSQASTSTAIQKTKVQAPSTRSE